jgi:hypothetical protein
MRALALVLLVSGCATVVPMQTASVVPKDALRVGGQLSASAFCGVASQGLVGLTRCTEYPDGIPLPELRGNVRWGIGHAIDLGASLQVAAQVSAPEKPMQIGLTLDAKRELFTVTSSSSVSHVVSLGLLANSAVAGRLTLAPWAQVEWGVPLFYGLRLNRFELVGTAAFSQRFTFPRIGADTAVAGLASYRLSFAVGLYRRAPSGWAVQLGYSSDPKRFLTGTILLQMGWMFDVPL